MVNVVADNVDVINRRAKNNEARTITFKDFVGISYITNIEIYNTLDPSTETTIARVRFNTDDGTLSNKYREIRPGGSYSIDAKIRNIVIMGVDGDADLQITVAW